MSALADFVLLHTERGACTCGKCFDAPPNPQELQPTGHTADVGFFKVALVGEPDVLTFKKLIHEHVGEFCDLNPLDGRAVNYITVGAWIGDQGLAMQFMGLGALLGLWTLIVLPSGEPLIYKRNP